MLSLLKRYREPLVVGLLLLYPFATFLSRGNVPREPNFVDRILVGLTSPLQWVLTFAIDGVGSGWSGYVALRGVRAHNAQLLTENAQLRGQLTQVEEVRLENERLKRLLAYAEGTSDAEIPARILGINPVSTFLSVRINRGEADGVARGMPVVAPDGIVGRVERVTGGYADVMLVTDENSRVGVRVQRSRLRATAAGVRGSKLLALEHALRTEDLAEGDLVVTSGTDGVFPPGLAVGQVTKLEKKRYGMFQSAEIQPAVELTKLEEVLVIPVRPPDPTQLFRAAAGEAKP